MREDDPDDTGLEEAEEATLGGDVARHRPGSVRAALSHREFRRFYAGSLSSNVGTWMQNVALGAFAYELTRSPSFVALLGFAQLGPLLVLSVVGGALADAVDRRKLLIACQVEQMVLSFALAWVAAQDEPSRVALVAVVAGIGIGNALNAPALSSVLPILVGRRDLPGAVSLQSTQLNLSRVVGPAIGGLLLPRIGASGIFVLNGFTYLFVIGVLLVVAIPRPYPTLGEQGLARLLSGFAYARRDRFVRQCLLTMFVMSFCTLPFIGLMPVIAAENLGVRPDSTPYGILYACFGLGAAVGAVSVGTLLVDRPKHLVVPAGFAAFGVTLVVFGLLRSAPPAFPAIFAVGVAYFTTVTSLSTALQQHLSDEVRGRVMALWIMAFGGTVPIGLLVAGAIADQTSVTVVVLGGALVALGLAAFSGRRQLVPATAS